ncbi:MAG: hypothetical protein HY396_01380 [Candidatus Doudnabacteria bacterium]|nr:hypothetical protein [Candidatus Doudnabacteria bacterium]
MLEENQEKDKIDWSILDTISASKQSAALRAFNVAVLVQEFLSMLKTRERDILTARFGLENGQGETLENIGKKLDLTRERVRQIEKETFRRINQSSLSPSIQAGIELIFQVIEDRGKIARENLILDAVLLNNDTEIARQGVLFVLKIIPRFFLLKENALYHQGWYVAGFDKDIFQKVIDLARDILKSAGQPLSQDRLFGEIRKQSHEPDIAKFSDAATESYLAVSKAMDRNPYQLWGLGEWPQIHPKDMGDKAYLVLLHHKIPEHYGKITELINKQSFDRRIAHKETVHNELIKDKRFVLIGRGIYALKEWGYKEGVVADVIAQALHAAARPLSKEEIIDEVMKQRKVKRNTVIVALSNRKRFQKTPEGKYTEKQNV